MRVEHRELELHVLNTRMGDPASGWRVEPRYVEGIDLFHKQRGSLRYSKWEFFFFSMVGTYDDIVGSIPLLCLCLPNTVVRYTLDAQYGALLEGPCRNIQRNEGIHIRSSTRLRRLLRLLRCVRSGKRIAKHLDAAGPHDARAGPGLEAREDGEVRAGPEALAAALGRIREHVRLAVARRVRRDALRGRAQDRDELRARAQREGRAREEHLVPVCLRGEDWERRGAPGSGSRGGHGDGHDGPWARALGEVRDERGVGRWEDETKLRCEGTHWRLRRSECYQ